MPGIKLLCNKMPVLITYCIFTTWELLPPAGDAYDKVTLGVLSKVPAEILKFISKTGSHVNSFIMIISDQL